MHWRTALICVSEPDAYSLFLYLGDRLNTTKCSSPHYLFTKPKVLSVAEVYEYLQIFKMKIPTSGSIDLVLRILKQNVFGDLAKTY